MLSEKASLLGYKKLRWKSSYAKPKQNIGWREKLSIAFLQITEPDVLPWFRRWIDLLVHDE